MGLTGLLMRFRLFQKFLVWCPAAIAGYVPFAAIAFGEHSVGQQAGITAALIALPASGGLSWVGRKVKRIPSNWHIELENASTFKQTGANKNEFQKAFTHQIKDEHDQVLMPHAISSKQPYPLFALISAANDCSKVAVVAKEGEVINIRQGRTPTTTMGAKQLGKLEDYIALNSGEEEIVDANLDIQAEQRQARMRGIS